MSVSNTNPRLYKLLDQLKSEKGTDYAGRMDLFVHIVLGFHELVKFVHCEDCDPEARDIANALIEKTVLLMSNEGVDKEEFAACFKAAKADYEEFEAAEDAAAKETKDVLSRVSTNIKH